MENRQPALFLSHGSPMLAIENSSTSIFLKKLGKTLLKPRAIVIFSAHLDLADEIIITAAENPGTIHDFGGFPAELYSLYYNAPGSPELAEDIAARFKQAGLNPVLDKQRGWDHGVWIPLLLMYPEADIPIVQISINSRAGASQNYAYGKLVAPVREKNILVIGSGGISHNLSELFRADPTPQRMNMIKAFTAWVNDKLMTGDINALLDYLEQAPHVLFNHPTQEHFVPFFAALGSGDIDNVTRIHQAIEHDVLAMDAYSFGTLAVSQSSDRHYAG